MSTRNLLASLLVLGSLVLVPPSSAQAQGGVKAGVLKCNVGSGWGFIFGSSKDLKCIYSKGGGQAPERYAGEIRKYGVDIGYTEGGVLVWTVVAPALDVKPGALAGDYVGGTAEITAGYGLGANALVGGSGDQIALQPLSIQGQEGLNVAAGVGAIHLKAVR